MKKSNEKMDFSSIIGNIDKVKAMKAAKQKKQSTSIKPLKFEENSEDTPLKAEIIRRINAKNLVYSDLYNYCAKLKDGDINEGQKLGYNIISGLRNRHSMIDSTLTLLCDWLGLDIMFVERAESDEEDEEEDE
jgi:hypothetical protein